MTASQLILEAQRAFTAQTGLLLEVDAESAPPRITIAGTGISFGYECRLHLEDQISESGSGVTQHVLVLPHVTPTQAQRLRSAGVGFLDTSGNAYLAHLDLAFFVWVTGQKRVVADNVGQLGNGYFTSSTPSLAADYRWHTVGPTKQPAPGTTGQKRSPALSTAVARPGAIRLLFALLAEPALLAAPYRQMVTRTGLTPGTITQVFVEWKRQGLLQITGTLRKPVRHWRLPRQELIRLWVGAYGDRLRPRLVKGRYRLPTHPPWTELLLPAQAAWSGEPAAALLLNGHLLPERLTLYAGGNAAGLILLWRLRPDTEGELEIIEELIPAPAFPTGNGPPVVHPLLAYADLWLSQDARNREMATLLYAKYLENPA